MVPYGFTELDSFSLALTLRHCSVSQPLVRDAFELLEAGEEELAGSNLYWDGIYSMYW